MEKMRAAIRTGLMGYIISFTSDHPKPKFSEKKNASEVLVEVQAAAINPIDYKLPRLFLGPVVGIDFCGKVTAIGSKVKDFAVGDIVYGVCSKGSLAEFTIAPADKIAKKPDDWTASEAAALPVAYGSTLQALRKGSIVPPEGEGRQSKESCLVIGASGGCGLAAVQLCKAMSVPRIVAVCSAKNADLVRNAGATEFVDYTDEKGLTTFFSENAGLFDCVFDAATGSGKGEDYIEKSVQLLKRAEDADGGRKQNYIGKYVFLNGRPMDWARAFTGKEKPHQSLILAQLNTRDLESIPSLLDKVSAKPLLNVMPFSEDGVRDAFSLLQSRRARGKVVFDVTGGK